MTTTFHDEGHGYDVFGMRPDAARLAARIAAPIYERYFRATSEGTEHIPREGRAILVANHSGALPVDGAMLWTDVYRHTGRITRLVADRFVPQLPFVGTIFSRCGVVCGARANVERLLEREEILAIFPEGTTGVGKPMRLRYQLQEWRVGHAELAIRHRAPIVPVAIIGAEESWPVVYRIPLQPFGAPYLPVPASPLPLPVRYHFHYGAPIELHREVPADRADDPDAVIAAAGRVRHALEQLIERALTARESLFR